MIDDVKYCSAKTSNLVSPFLRNLILQEQGPVYPHLPPYELLQMIWAIPAGRAIYFQNQGGTELRKIVTEIDEYQALTTGILRWW